MTLADVILNLALGAFAGLVRSDLRLAEARYDTPTRYRLLAIGLVGSGELGNTTTSRPRYSSPCAAHRPAGSPDRTLACRPAESR